MNKVAQIKHQEKSQSAKNFSIENLYRCSLDFDFGSNDDDDDDDDDKFHRLLKVYISSTYWHY